MRKALVFGVDGESNNSKGACVASAYMFTTFIAKRGFEVRLLVDDEEGKPGQETYPTGGNMIDQIQSFVAEAMEGDELVMYYCGHAFGCNVDDPTKHGIHCADSRVISSRRLTSLLSKLPKNCSCTVIFDTCYSAGLIRNLEEQFSPTANGMNNDRRSQKQLTVFGACERFEKSGSWCFEDEGEDETRIGVFTYVMCKDNFVPPSSVREWLLQCRRALKGEGFGQVPTLFCCKDNVHGHFICAPRR